MRIKAAVCYGEREPLVVEEVELDPPRANEVLIKYVASGVCHSDVSIHQGFLPRDYPLILGHEGAGIIERVGEGVTAVQPGDHVVLGFIPSCGTCKWCHVGVPILCDLGAHIRTGKMIDGTARHHSTKDGRDLHTLMFISTFAEYSVVPEASVVKVPEHLPLEKLCLLGCGFTTGFGAATNAIHIKPGETVTIVGCGGLGTAAIQGARLSGAGKIIAVDVQEAKLDLAKKFGATHTVRSRGNPEEVVNEILEINWGVGTDYSMEFVGGDQTDDTARVAFNAVRKGGTMVMIGVAERSKQNFAIDPYTLALWSKRIVGVLFGNAQFRVDIPRYAELYDQGKIDLDGMVTQEIELGQINQAFDDVLAGDRVIRSVIRF